MTARVETGPKAEIKKMRRIGVIGGLGPQATIDFLDRLHKFSATVIPQFANRGFPPVMVDFVREAPMLVLPDGTPIEPLQPDPKLLAAAKRLGPHSDFLVIASNTPHFFKSQIEKASGKKVLSIVDVVVEEVKRRGYEKVAVLAVGVTLRNRLYQDPLETLGVECITPSERLVERMDNASWSLMEGKKPNMRPVNEASREFSEKADGIILGCTEFPLLMHSGGDDYNIINSTQLLAEAAVRYAIE